jgi:hypothetical protein
MSVFTIRTFGLSAIAALSLEACSKPAPKPTGKEWCDPTPENSQCVLTLEPANIPNVSIEGVSVVPTLWEPKWTTYPGVCSSHGFIGYKDIPDQNGNIFSTYETGIWSLTPLANGNQPFVHCYVPSDPNWLLSPIDQKSWFYDEEAVRPQIESLAGLPVERIVLTSPIQIDSSELAVAFYSPDSTRVGLALVNLQTNRAVIPWKTEISGTANTPRVYIDGGNLIFEAMKEDHAPGVSFSRSVLDEIFNLTTKAHVGTVSLPEEALFYDPTSIEGVSVDQFRSQMVMDLADRHVIGNELAVLYRPFISTMYYPSLIDIGIKTQRGRDTLSGYDIVTGETKKFPLPIYEGKQFVFLEDKIAVVGITKPYFDGETLMGTPTVILLNGESGATIGSQEIGSPMRIYGFIDGDYTHTYLKFSKDGKRFQWDQTVYEFDGALFQRAETVTQADIQPDDFLYTYPEWPTRPGGPFSTAPSFKFGSHAEAADKVSEGKRVYAGLNRDFVLVDPSQKNARYFRLPIAEPCYSFGFPNFIGGVDYIRSCEIELGGVTIQGGQLLIGYKDQIWQTELP